MKNSQNIIQAFVEAHYYPDGLDYFHVSLTKDRPAWAPPSNDVGLFDEDNVTLSQRDLVIEFKRKIFLGKQLTWCGVYSRSVDETVGDRGNHAGVGVWLYEYHITDFRYVIRCLRTLLYLVAGKFDRVRFEEKSAEFLRKALPTSVHLIAEFPDSFSGIPFSQTTSSTKFVTESKVPDFDEMIDDAADHLIYLSFGHDIGTYSRALIHVPVGTELPTSNKNVQIISRHDDKLSKIISSIPGATVNAASKVASLQADLKDAQSQNVELQASFAEKNEEVYQLETKVAALQSEIDLSVQTDVSTQILRQLKLTEQNIITTFLKHSGSLPRSQNIPPEKRGPPSPYVSTIQNPSTRNKAGPKNNNAPLPYSDQTKSNNFFWSLIALSAFSIFCAIGIVLWLRLS